MRASRIGWLLIGLAALACSRRAPAPPPIDPALAATDSGVLAAARAAADSFVVRWRYTWESSEWYRNAAVSALAGLPIAAQGMRVTIRTPAGWDPPEGVAPLVLTKAESAAVAIRFANILELPIVPRGTLIHCHPDGSYEVAGPSMHARLRDYMIPSDVGRRAVCPSWYPVESPPPWDERDRIDVSLLEQFHPSIIEARDTLIQLLGRAAARLPGDRWLTGQRVRFALDQADTAAARRIVAACRAERWWCTALTGYLANLRGDVARADSTFLVMLREMPEPERCEWTDLGAILDDEARVEYAKISCAARDSVNARIWWLADPLFTETRNARRAEHYARRVLVKLRTGTVMNERWDMRTEGGGVAVIAMLLRYGWPSYSHWAGSQTDVSHYGYLGIGNDKQRYHGRFATAEYTAPRFHTIPSWPAIAGPSRSVVANWSISASAWHSIDPADSLWWPREHYERPEGPLVQLWNQTGMFRRDNDVLLAVAMNLVHEDLDRVPGDTLRGVLILGSGPDSMSGSPARGIVGTRMLLRKMITSEPQLVSVELHSARTRAAVRSRFGIEPPRSLAAMRPGELTVSQPVLIRPAPPEEIPPTHPDRALPLMMGSDIFTPAARVGVYWETYGAAPGDTVDIALRIERRVGPPGFFRRVGISFGLASSGAAGVSVGWREPRSTNEVSVIPGSVPIVGRNITVDLSSLGTGAYSLTVSVKRPGGTPITSQRDFWLVER